MAVKNVEINVKTSTGYDQLYPTTAVGNVSGAATTVTYLATLSTSWVGSVAPYTQTVSVAGILSTDNPIADIILSNTESVAISQLSDYAKLSKFVTSNGSIVFTCLEEKPTVVMNLQLKVVR